MHRGGNPVGLIFFQFPELTNVACVFTDRSISLQSDAPRETRETLLAKYAPLGLDELAEARQVHGTGILLDPAPTPPGTSPQTEADGLMTSTPGLGLLIRTADCQPVLLASRNGAAIMALHVGWKGNRMNFIGRAVPTFCAKYVLTPQDILAVRGPSLGHAEFVNFNDEWGEDFAPWHDPHTRAMNLWQLTAFQLRSAGIPANQIYGIDICTMANADDFFSHRARKDKGRQAGIIWRIPPTREAP